MAELADLGIDPTKPTSDSMHSSSTSAPPAAKKLFSIVVISAPLLLCVSLLHLSPSSLLSDAKFWFLMSNAIILIVAADSGIFATAAASIDGVHADVYEEYVKHHNRWRSSVVHHQEPPRKEDDPTTCLALVPVEGEKEEEEYSSKVAVRCSTDRRSTSSELAAPHNHGTEQGKMIVLRRSTTEKKDRVTSQDQESEYSAMSDEELNRRVEEFIRRFNMEIRRQQVMGNDRD